MAERNEEKRCAHPSCECAVSQDNDYCSPHCETAPDTEGTCSCGHAACLAGKMGSVGA